MDRNRAVAISDLSVKFDGKLVVDNFSMRLELGEKVVMVGKSGSGKSTILRCILGFVIPDIGSISIKGEMLTPKTVWKLRTNIAYLPQEPDLGTGEVLSVLELPFTYSANQHLEKNTERIPELFEQLQLPLELLEKDISTLSGGEKQRVGLVASLLLDRDIILLDEVTSSLDKGCRQTIDGFLSSFNGPALLIISHTPEEFSFPERMIELPCCCAESDNEH